MTPVQMRPSIRIMLATAAFAAVHSALAGRGTKRVAARLFGERNRNGLYRVFYIGQSSVTFGILAMYARRQPGRVIYEAHGPLATSMRSAQLLSFAVATSAASEIGLRRITGIENFFEWLGHGPVQSEPEAQGPATIHGKLQASGPFTFSRHPLNFWPLPILWLNPRMTTNILSFNLAATVYLILGSAHEEARLRKAYGREYINYQRSDVPFYTPRIPGRIRRIHIDESGAD
jgi:hypothetical protein